MCKVYGANMALNIKNERVHALAREASERLGRSQASVIEEALRKLLDDLGPGEETRGAKGDRVRTLVADFRFGLTDQERAAIRLDLAEMYDEHGLPT